MLMNSFVGSLKAYNVSLNINLFSHIIIKRLKECLFLYFCVECQKKRNCKLTLLIEFSQRIISFNMSFL